jgi:hypothetical protein
MTALNAVDASRWGGDLTRVEAQCMKDAGIGTFIAACGPGGYGNATVAQIDDAIAVGLTPEAYTFYEWGNGEAKWIDDAAASLGEYRNVIKRFWIDIEDTSRPVPLSWRATLDALFRAADWTFPNAIVGAYIPVWYMRGHMGLTNASQIVVLGGKRRQWWNSFYDGDPDIDAIPFADIEVSDVAIEQYQGTTEVCGQSVDLNHVYIPSQEGEMGMTTETEDMAMAIFCTREEIAGILEGTVTREEAITAAKGRVADRLARPDVAPNNTPIADALVSHLVAHPGGGVAPHTHVPGGVTR